MQKSEGTVVYKWDKAHMNSYNDSLMGDVRVNTYLQQMYEEGVSCDSVLSSFSCAIEHALRRLDHDVGHVITRQKPSSPNVSRPCNGWYNDDCKDARAAYVDVETRLGAASTEAKAAHKAYRRVVRAARRTWEKHRHEDFMHDISREPKRFWKSFGQSNQKGGHFDVDKWTVYFRDLFKCNGNGEHMEC